MTVFSPKARRLIEQAVLRLQDDVQRANWTAWAQLEHGASSMEKPSSDAERLPLSAAIAALSALESFKVYLRHRLSLVQSSEENEACDLENDLSFIDTVESILIRDLQDPLMPA